MSKSAGVARSKLKALADDAVKSKATSCAGNAKRLLIAYT
jgi:hypothetical protein